MLERRVGLSRLDNKCGIVLLSESRIAWGSKARIVRK
jgi:hypothetical protein